jgi:hypothetical protein
MSEGNTAQELEGVEVLIVQCTVLQNSNEAPEVQHTQ